MASSASQIKIITFTGASGVGKTIIARTLLDRYPLFARLESITTRSRRMTDFSGEYMYVSQEEFLQLISSEKCIEWAQVHGNDYYGTLKASVDKALSDPNHVYLKTIDPIGLEKLYAFAPSALLPFYIVAPSESVLKQRLTDRGENEETIRNRIHDCAQWNEKARRSHLPYVFVENNKTIEDAIITITEYLKGMI